MTLLQILVIAVVAFFCILFVRDGMKRYVGYNPAAPSLWARIKAWWPGFVKRHIVDDDPYDDETHAETRYYDKPTPEQIECARTAAKAGLGNCNCPGNICMVENKCPVKHYCHGDNSIRLLSAVAWLESNGIKP